MANTRGCVLDHLHVGRIVIGQCGMQRDFALNALRKTIRLDHAPNWG